MKFLLTLIFVSSNAFAYIPSVESLFRHGSNPDITANGVSLTLVVKRIEVTDKVEPKNNDSLLKESKPEDHYKIFYTKIGSDVYKVAQTRYDNGTFSEGSLLGKNYYPNFSPYTIKGSPEESEKGIFQGMLISMLFNNGSFFLNYLKSIDVPVKLNSEIINRQKVTYLASYKQYLVGINKDRSTKKTELNPLKPEDPTAREKIELAMKEPMYVDQKQVKLSRENGEIAWLINAGTFEAVVSYKEREIKRIKYKSQLGDFEVIAKDYWLANGTHALPRYLLVKDYKGEMFQVEILNLRHYLEKESDLINRLKKWDSLLKGKENNEPKPPFLL
ncbi:MAG: hypothetical protein H0V66_05670 [Bdellovibrionales bacterium]|nr:hypothetical protein [Bdellovibrionales bacterium]